MHTLSGRERTGLFLTTASLVMWAGGLTLLGAVVAPHVFLHAGLGRAEAGAVMAPLFLAFDRWILALMAVFMVGEFLRLGARPLAGALRLSGVALALILVGSGAWSSLRIGPAIERLRLEGARAGVGPEGLRFDRLHNQSERLGKFQVLGCAALLAAAWIPPGPGGRRS
jgi:hypothetical protein